MTDLFFSVNGVRATSGVITIPYYGLWVADVVLATTTPVSNLCSLVVGNLTLQGAAYRMASFAGARSVRLTGGYGGWRNPVPFQEYSNPGGVRLSTVLGDAARSVGERVAVQADVSLGTYWFREAAPASRVLRLLAGPTWWVDPAGITQVGTRTSTAITSQYLINDWSGAKGKFEVSTEDYASWMPGNTFSNELVTTPQTISMTIIEADNDGVLRLQVLSTGAADLP